MKKEGKTTRIQTPSPFGSHLSMVVADATAALSTPGMVVCIDENGEYITELWRLDSGLSDPNRTRESRLKRQSEIAR